MIFIPFKCSISVTCKVKFHRTLPSIFCQTQTSCDNTRPVRIWNFSTLLFFFLFFQLKKIRLQNTVLYQQWKLKKGQTLKSADFRIRRMTYIGSCRKNLFSTFKWLLTACYQNTNGILCWSHIANRTFYLHSANISTTFVVATKLSFALGIKVDVMRTALTSYSGLSVRKIELCFQPVKHRGVHWWHKIKVREIKSSVVRVNWRESDETNSLLVVFVNHWNRLNYTLDPVYQVQK